ncbi:hypothetical protein VP01_2846g1 [Puccinia sorghi]|uniref:Uncharacterized protein n=1 Tax=Puccinia sorghi TaxID=27349 RepID=A0A0L6V240_9BASI|nr:hypothetical protein VP01_2846g1 [Puccinia sorghi]
MEHDSEFSDIASLMGCSRHRSSLSKSSLSGPRTVCLPEFHSHILLGLKGVNKNYSFGKYDFSPGFFYPSCFSFFVSFFSLFFSFTLNKLDLLYIPLPWSDRRCVNLTILKEACTFRIHLHIDSYDYFSFFLLASTTFSFWYFIAYIFLLLLEQIYPHAHRYIGCTATIQDKKYNEMVFRDREMAMLALLPTSREMLLIWCYCVRPTHPIHLTLVDFPSARILLSLDLLISNFKLCLVMKHDDRWVPITTQSLEFGLQATSPPRYRFSFWITEHGGQTTTMFHFSPLKQIGLRKSWLCHQESWIFLYFVNTKSGSFSCNVVGFQCRNHHHASCSRKSTLVMHAKVRQLNTSTSFSSPHEKHTQFACLQENRRSTCIHTCFFNLILADKCPCIQMRPGDLCIPASSIFNPKPELSCFLDEKSERSDLVVMNPEQESTSPTHLSKFLSGLIIIKNLIYFVLSELKIFYQLFFIETSSYQISSSTAICSACT